MDTTRILVFTAKRGDIPVLEFRFAFIYIRTCISSLKEKKKKLHRFFEDLLTEQFEKKKKKEGFQRITSHALGKKSTLSLQQNEKKSRELSKRLPTKSPLNSTPHTSTR